MKQEITSEKYMIRKKFYIPKDEHTRFYGHKGDLRPYEVSFEEEINEEEWF